MFTKKYLILLAIAFIVYLPVLAFAFALPDTWQTKCYASARVRFLVQTNKLLNIKGRAMWNAFIFYCFINTKMSSLITTC